MQHTKQEIFDFITAQPRMVLSTVTKDGASSSAIMGFGVTENFEIVFGTFEYMRKVENMHLNPMVSIVTGFDQTGTIQYEGTVRQLEGPEVDRYAEYHFAKHPRSRRYKNEPGQIYFLITPTWIRFTEVTYTPWKVTELSFSANG